MRAIFRSIIAILFSLFLAPMAAAVEPGEVLVDPVKEARARALSTELRCLVCQNQSIDDSNAELAKDLRLLVRRRIEAGDTDDAVRSYLVARYGEFVLLKPTFAPHTWLLWTFPFFGLGMGIFLAWRSNRKTASGEEAIALNGSEQRQLDEILQASTVPKSGALH